MKEVFLIGCHIKNELQLSYLSELIYQLKSAQKDYIIVSHTQIPEFLTKDSVAYLYDSENTIISNKKIQNKNLYWFANDNFRIKSPTLGYGSYDNYSIAVLNLLFRGIIIAKTYGYSVMHWVEYDFEINIQESNDNFEKLKLKSDIGLIGYFPEDNIHSNFDDDFIKGGLYSHIFGSFMSFNLQNLNSEFICFNTEVLFNKLIDVNFCTEHFTEMNSVSKIFKKKLSVLNKKNRYSMVNDRQFNFALFEKDESINIFLVSTSDKKVTITIKTESKKQVVSLDFDGHWTLLNLGRVSFLNIKTNFNFELDIDLSDNEDYNHYIGNTFFEDL